MELELGRLDLDPLGLIHRSRRSVKCLKVFGINPTDGILLYMLRKWPFKAGKNLLDTWCLGRRLEVDFIKCVWVFFLITKSRKLRKNKEQNDPYDCHTWTRLLSAFGVKITLLFSSKYTFLRTKWNEFYCEVCGFHFSQRSVVCVFHSVEY